MRITDGDIKKYKPFVERVANYVLSRCHKDIAIEKEDLVQEGLIELCICLEKYKSNGFSRTFEEFSFGRIKDAMSNFLISNSFTKKKKKNGNFSRIDYDDEICFIDDDLEDGICSKIDLDKAHSILIDNNTYEHMGKEVVSKRNRTIFLKTIFGEKTKLEIANEHNISRGRVSSINRSVRKYLKKQLGGKNELV